jgi:hypothetical protein
MAIPNRQTALEAVNQYEKIYESIPTLIDESNEPLSFWAKELNLSNPAISNKKNGRRDWKVSEVKIILNALKKDSSVVDAYVNVLENIDAMIYERGFKKLLFYHRVGLNNIQIFTRQHSKDKGYNSWQIEEIKKLVENL